MDSKASCLQTLSASSSTNTLAYTERWIIAGSQTGDLHVWDRQTYRLAHLIHAHHAGCHSLVLDGAHRVLFSGGGDSRVRAWDTGTLELLYTVHAGANSGAILALAYHQGTLYLGCQNATIQKFNIQDRDNGASEQERMAEIGRIRRSRFFDEFKSPLSVSTSTSGSGSSSGSSSSSPQLVDEKQEQNSYVVFAKDTVSYAHGGYVNCLVADQQLVSAASDGSIKTWELETLKPIRSLERIGDEAADVCVHSLALEDGLLFAGRQAGGIEVWDMETLQRVRVLGTSSREEVFSLSVHRRCLYAGLADGSVQVWGMELQRLGELGRVHESALATQVMEGGLLLTGGAGRSAAAVWDISSVSTSTSTSTSVSETEIAKGLTDRRMVESLERWVGFRSISGETELQPECRRAARYLRDLCRELGASDARLISGAPETNPLVYARFQGQQPAAEKTILVYGHYDVMPAGDPQRWQSQPWEMSGRDGYLYGRGVTDNKGPVMAILYAVAELHEQGRLDKSVVFCIEGEEENGSRGLRETVEKHRELFGQPELVLLSSSYWLDETTPCLTYGMRGSIRVSLRVESSRVNSDVHAGVWGGAVNEPLTCMSHLLSRLSDAQGNVLVPGFHDSVRPVDAEETEQMRELAEHAGLDMGQLMRRWRQPAMTVHRVEADTVADRSNQTLVPAAAHAQLSVRVVPDQSLAQIAQSLQQYIREQFDLIARGDQPLDQLKLELEVRPVAKWWLADPHQAVYKRVAQAIADVWQMDRAPLLIREGGSIPAVPWLEDLFGTLVVNLPMGQSSDNAHMDNERICLENLVKGRRVVSRLCQ